MPNKGSPKGFVGVYVAVWLIVLAILSGILSGGFFQGYTALKITYLIVLPPVIAALVLYLMRLKKEGSIPLLKGSAETPAFSVAASFILFSLWPFFLKINSFLFMDDLYIFNGRALNNLGEMLQYGRPLAMLLQSLYSGMSWESSHKGRIITALFILIFALMVYLWLLRFAKQGYVPLLGAVLVAGSFTVADMTGLICIIHMPLGLIFSGFSIMLLYEVLNNRREFRGAMVWILGVSALFSLYFGFNHYAIATPIIFFFLAVPLLYEPWGRKQFVLLVWSAVLLAVAGALYYLSVHFFSQLYGVVGQISARGTVGLSLDFYIQKVQWFVETIIPQGIYKVMALFLGRNQFAPHNLYFATEPVSLTWKAGLLGTYVLIAGFGIFRLLRRGKGIQALILMAFLPLSFYPMLILPQSDYMSYYAFANFALLMLFFLWSCMELAGVIWQRLSEPVHRLTGKLLPYAVFGLCLLSSIHVNEYVQEYWIDYNKAPRVLVEDALLREKDLLEETGWIHVFGSQTPVQVTNYPLQLIQHTLRDMGFAAVDIRITASIFPFASNGIVPALYEELKLTARPDQQGRLADLHHYDSNYNLYWLRGGISEEDSNFLREIYTKAGLIPASDEDALIIDLTRVREQVVF